MRWGLPPLVLTVFVRMGASQKGCCAVQRFVPKTFFQNDILKTRVRIPPGYQDCREIVAMLLCKIDLDCMVCMLKKRNKVIRTKTYSISICSTEQDKSKSQNIEHFLIKYHSTKVLASGEGVLDVRVMKRARMHEKG
jgi:hypothetical protein